MKADLHIHSTGSDGRHSLDYLLESYSKKNFDVVAITDHYVVSHSLRDDNVLKMKEERYNIKIIIGMEAVGEVNDEWIHLLCYFNKNADFSEGIHKYLYGQTIFVKDLNNKVKKIMKEKNIDIPDIDYSLLDPYSYTPILMEVVKRTNLSLKEARGEFFTYMKDLSIPEEYKLTTKELIEEVHKSKGLVFMAHPLQFENETILKAIELGIDGLEAIYPSYDDTQREYLISLAKEHNILYSAESDFHCSIVDSKRHGEIGSVALTGTPLKKFMTKLTGIKQKESLESMVSCWLKDFGVILEKNYCGEQYFATYNNATVVINLVDFNLNNTLFKLNSSKEQSMSILDKLNVPHIAIYPLDKKLYYEEALRFFEILDNKCVIRGDKGVCGENTFIIDHIKDLKSSLDKLIAKDVKPLISPYYDALYEYRVYFLNGKAELVVKKIRNEQTGKHNLSTGATAEVVTDSELIYKLEEISNKVSNIFGLNFVAIDIMDTNEGLKVIEFGIPNIKKFASFSEENEKLARNLFLKAFNFKLKESNL